MNHRPGPVKPILRAALLLGFIGLLLVACKLAGSGPVAIPSAAPSATLAAATSAPTSTPIATEATETARAPTATALPPTVTATAEPVTPDPSASLQEIVQSEAWTSLGMDPDQAQRWEEYARTGAGLSSKEELAYLKNFVDQWQLLNAAAQQAIVPKDASLALRVLILDHEIGGAEPVLYPVVAGEAAPAGGDQLYLVARDSKGLPVGLLAAPVITGLRQQASADGQYVEYVDEQRNVRLLSANAHKVSMEGASEETLTEMLDAVYTNLSPYTRSRLYPRYFFHIEGVEASFYTVETLLTYLQIVQLNEAFQFLDRPEFAPVKNAIFTQGTSVTIIEQADLYAGLTVLGSGVMQLDRRDILGDKYLLASVLVHEGAHILQPTPKSGGDMCKKALRLEVGSQNIPPDFFKWTAEQVLEGIDSQEIGAYHAGFWVLGKIGVLGERYYWPDWREILQTGKTNGQWIAGVCE